MYIYTKNYNNNTIKSKNKYNITNLKTMKCVYSIYFVKLVLNTNSKMVL